MDSKLAEELRLLLDAAAERAQPWLHRVAAEGEHDTRTCGWCPLCNAVALARGDRSELAAKAAEHVAGLIAVLRAALAEPGTSETGTSGTSVRVVRAGGGRAGAGEAPCAAHPGGAARPGDAVLTVGVDVGGTSVRAGVVDGDGAVLDTARAATPSGEEALEEAIGQAVAELASRHRISGVGLAVAGFVASDRRTVRFAPHLAWRQAPVAERISQRVGMPVVLEHDANAAALAEHRFGAARGAKIAALVAIGTGIGGALLIDGQVFRGAYGVAPELGHLRLVPDGRPCPCGKNGCWERYCSGTALSTTAVELLARYPGQSTVLAREALGDSRAVTGRRVAGAARDGDPLAQRAMADLARWLGEGLALVADVYDPEVVVIGGGVSESAPLFLDDARERYAAVVTGAGHRPLARIRTAQLGDDAGIVGVATLARDVAASTARNGRHR